MPFKHLLPHVSCTRENYTKTYLRGRAVLWGSQHWFSGKYLLPWSMLTISKFQVKWKTEVFGSLYPARRPYRTKHCCEIGRAAEPAVNPSSEVGNKSRVMPILQVIVCAPLPESLHWPSKGTLDRPKTPWCNDFFYRASLWLWPSGNARR